MHKYCICIRNVLYKCVDTMAWTPAKAACQVTFSVTLLKQLITVR